MHAFSEKGLMPKHYTFFPMHSKMHAFSSNITSSASLSRRDDGPVSSSTHRHIQAIKMHAFVVIQRLNQVRRRNKMKETSCTYAHHQSEVCASAVYIGSAKQITNTSTQFHLQHMHHSLLQTNWPMKQGPDASTQCVDRHTFSLLCLTRSAALAPRPSLINARSSSSSSLDSACICVHVRVSIHAVHESVLRPRRLNETQHSDVNMIW